MVIEWKLFSQPAIIRQTVNGAFLSKCIGKLGENFPQYFASTPLLKTTMDRFIVRIVLRQLGSVPGSWPNVGHLDLT